MLYRVVCARLAPLMLCGTTARAFAEHRFKEFGPFGGVTVKPFFDGLPPPQALIAIRFVGGLLAFLGPVLFVTRWNTVNGKAAALGFLIAAINSAAIGRELDKGAFQPRGWYVFATWFSLAALHMAFNANPKLTSAMLREKEEAAQKKKR